MWDDDYRLDNEDLPFEIHHDVISSSEQVQIYEMVMGDINGDFTTILDQGYEPLKDNRLLPLGFSLTHPVYDTTIVAGAALSDPNYGVNDVSNKDKITFEVALDGYTGLLHFEARAYYQSLPQRWMDQIFEVETEAIDFFESMYYNADRSPVLMDSDELDDDIFVGITGSKEELFSVNPKLGSGEITIKVPSPGGFQLVTSSGQVIRKEELMAGSQEFKFDIPAGIYYVVLRFGGEVAVERIMVI
jgi:hypothetical protein